LLRPTASRLVLLCVRHFFGAYDQILLLSFNRQLVCSSCGTSCLMRGPVCNLQSHSPVAKVTEDPQPYTAVSSNTNFPFSLPFTTPSEYGGSILNCFHTKIDRLLERRSFTSVVGDRGESNHSGTTGKGKGNRQLEDEGPLHEINIRLRRKLSSLCFLII
jgi:hypothetical protein